VEEMVEVNSIFV